MPDKFRLIIAGSRTFDDYVGMCEELDKILVNKENIIVISGTAKGADTLGEKYALEKGYEVERYPADWDSYGKKAGFIRNKQMGDLADALACFIVNNSNGSTHMVNYMNNLYKPVRVFHYTM